MATMTYLQAISDGMRSEMRNDERVLVMGEDIGVFGGAFKVTDGFIDEFGPDRVMDTPLAESGIVGTAIGAAVVGMRPIAEMQFADFISCGFDQLVNVAAKLHYRQGVAVPMVVPALGLDRATVKFSADSTVLSPATFTVMVLLVSPAAKLTVPVGKAPPVKSAAVAGLAPLPVTA